MLRFACEHCGRQIETNPEDAQRTIHCPGCLKPVTVPAAGQAPKAPAGGSGGTGTVVIVGLIVLVLAGGGGAWWWYQHQKKDGPDNKPGAGVEGDGPEVSDLRLLPGNAQVVGTIRSAELYKLQAARDALEQSRKRDPKWVDPAAQLERDVNLKPDEVELLHVVSPDVDLQLAWVVARTVKPIDREKVLSKINGKTEKYEEGRRYYLGKNPVGDEIAVHVAGPNVLVVSDEAGVKLAMKQAARPIADGPQKPTIGLVETSKSKLILGLNPAGGGTKWLEGNAQLKGLAGADWARITLDADDEKATLNLAAKAKDKKGAEELKNSLDGVLALLRGAVFLLTFSKDAEDKKTAVALKKFCDAAKVEVKGEEVRATATTGPATMATVMIYVREQAMKQKK
jgi:hypothetical protein